MNRYISLTIYASLIMITGIVLICIAYTSSSIIQITIGISSLISAVFAFITAYNSRFMPVQRNYHALHGIGFLVYGIAVLFYSTTRQLFLDITAFFLIYYAFAEFIFCFQRLMNEENTNLQKDIIRFVIGIVMIIGVIAILITSSIDIHSAFMICGLVFIISGINLILFKTVLREYDKAQLKKVV